MMKKVTGGQMMEIGGTKATMNRKIRKRSTRSTKVRVKGLAPSVTIVESSVT